jgi:ATP-dependent DNA helicase RecQ
LPEPVGLTIRSDWPFSATAGVDTQRRILESLEIPDATVLVADVDRPNIALYRCPHFRPPAKLDATAKLLKIRHGGHTMIFVPTVKVGETVRQDLAARGHDVPFYHAKLNEVDKTFLQGRFCGLHEPRLDVIICTNAFGMGLDVPDVRLVIHWQAPGSVEDYAQEFGRAGRNGGQLVAVLFGNAGDARLYHFMLEKTAEATAKSEDPTTRDDERIRAFVKTKSTQIDQMTTLATKRQTCFRRQIHSYFVASESSAPPSLSLRLIRWLFDSQKRRLDQAGCCDICDAVDAASLEQACRALLAPSTLVAPNGMLAKRAATARA